MRSSALVFIALFTVLGCTENSVEGLVIDRVSYAIEPPAGIQVRFRVYAKDHTILPQLTATEVALINDEKNRPFGAGGEGGSISSLGRTSNYGLYTVLALDMSDSIVKAGALGDVIDGALQFVEAAVASPEDSLKHNVAIFIFGRTDATRLVQDFTKDPQELKAVLDGLRQQTGLGGTNLYGAYLKALEKVGSVGKDVDLAERFVVILTDGTHEAGDEANLRAIAMAGKAASHAAIYSIGIAGDYDESKLAELASEQGEFIRAEKTDDLSTIFADVAARIQSLSRSNYVVGICTPVEIGAPSLTIRVSVLGQEGSRQIQYSSDQLNGDVGSCDPSAIVGLQMPNYIYLPDAAGDSESQASFCDRMYYCSSTSGVECIGYLADGMTECTYCVASSTCTEFQECVFGCSGLNI